MKHDDTQYQRTYRRYSLGFAAALVITYAAYLTTTQQWLSGAWLAAGLLGLAIIQLVVQLVVFLHVAHEKKPRWTLYSIIYSVIMMLIVVLGSLWVMYNLNYNMHATPEQMNEYMLEQNKKGF